MQSAKPESEFGARMIEYSINASFPMIHRIRIMSAFKRPVSLCAILLLLLMAPLFNSESAHGQTSPVIAPVRGGLDGASLGIPNSKTSAQLATEAMLARPASSFSIRSDRVMTVDEVIGLFDVTVFIDLNLEGCVDLDTEMKLKGGVSMDTCLYHALREVDAVYQVESDGTILLLSIDDELEPDYMRTLIYDVTQITGSHGSTESLLFALLNSIDSDSWEQNGSGNGTASIYQLNGHQLVSINQSYRIHEKIHFWLTSTAKLGGSSVVSAPMAGRANPQPTSIFDGFMEEDEPARASSVVAVPLKQTTWYRRQRRGFSRSDNSATSGYRDGGVF